MQALNLSKGHVLVADRVRIDDSQAPTRHSLAVTSKAAIPSQPAKPWNLYSEHRVKTRSLPVFKLPPDILCEVFLLVRKDPRNYPMPKGWASVTHVCRIWRAAALASRLLWRQVYLHGHLEQGLEYLKRAGSCSLAVGYNDPGYGPVAPNTYNLLNEVLSRPNEIVSLHIRVRCPLSFQEVLELLAPKLSGLLELNIAPYVDFFFPYSFHMPPVFLEARMPYLGEVMINHCRLSLDATMFSSASQSLTEIVLNRPGIRRPASCLLEALEAMPNLTNITLDRCVSQYPPSNPSKLFRLPRLQRFAVHDDTLACVNIVLSVESSAEVWVDFLDPEAGLTDGEVLQGKLGPIDVRAYSGVHNLLARYSSPPYENETYHFDIQFDNYGIVTFYLYRPGPSAPRALLSICFHLAQFHEPGTIPAFSAALPRAQIKTLLVGSDSGPLNQYSDRWLRELGRSLPNVTDLFLPCSSLVNLFPLTVVPAGLFDVNGEQTRDNIEFPGLRRIMVVHGARPFPNCKSIRRLHRLVAYRAQGKAPIEALLFARCTLTQHIGELLRPFVKRFDYL